MLGKADTPSNTKADTLRGTSGDRTPRQVHSFAKGKTLRKSDAPIQQRETRKTS